jgi:hypothetical protein
VRGPLIFLVSLLAVTAVGLVVVLPLWRERQELAAAGVSEPPAGHVPAAVHVALSNALRAEPSGLWAQILRDRLPELAAAAGARAGYRIEEGRVALEVPWDGLPGLLAGLAADPIPPVRSLTAVPHEEPEWCRLDLEFRVDPVPAGDR